MRAFIRRHPVVSSGGALAVVGLVVFVLVWFQPQKLFLDQTVNEALPGLIGSPAVRASSSRPPILSATPSTLPSPSSSHISTPKLTVLATGTFRSLEHHTTGTALVLARPDGTSFLRFEDLNTSNGPMLHAYLSELGSGGDLHAYGIRYVDLGPLKGNVGSQNYLLPSGLDLSKYRSAVIWCTRFKVGFGVAGLPDLASVESA
jgi:Electron transfer DM13